MNEDMQAPPTSDDADELLHVVVCLPVVHHRGNGEDQLGLDLREPVEDALQTKTNSGERRLRAGDAEQLEEEAREERQVAAACAGELPTPAFRSQVQ